MMEIFKGVNLSKLVMVLYPDISQLTLTKCAKESLFAAWNVSLSGAEIRYIYGNCVESLLIKQLVWKTQEAPSKVIICD